MDILAHLGERGLSGPRAAQCTALQTRAAKDGREAPDLRQEWQARAKDMGLDLGRVTAEAKERERAQNAQGEHERGKREPAKGKPADWRHERLRHTSRGKEQGYTREPAERERDRGPEWSR
jgi:hypothetical protein